MVAGRQEDRVLDTLDLEAGGREMYVADVATGQFQQILGPANSTGLTIKSRFEPGAPTWGPDSNTIALAVLQQYSNRFREGVSKILTVNATTGATNEYGADPANAIRDDHATGWRATGRCGRRTASTWRT